MYMCVCVRSIGVYPIMYACMRDCWVCLGSVRVRILMCGYGCTYVFVCMFIGMLWYIYVRVCLDVYLNVCACVSYSVDMCVNCVCKYTCA